MFCVLCARSSLPNHYYVISLVIGNYEKLSFDSSFFGALVSYPNTYGEVYDYHQFVDQIHQSDGLDTSCADTVSMHSVIMRWTLLNIMGFHVNRSHYSFAIVVQAHYSRQARVYLEKAAYGLSWVWCA